MVRVHLSPPLFRLLEQAGERGLFSLLERTLKIE